MSEALVPVKETMPEQVQTSLMITGDLKLLTGRQKQDYYVAICDRLGLDWRTRPFDYIELNGKLVLYARKDATEQLRKVHNVSLSQAKMTVDDKAKIVIMQVEASLPNGRTDGGTGVASLVKKLKIEVEPGETGPDGVVNKGIRPKVIGTKDVDLIGDEYANAIMKAETKAKRRATLSICGLGFLDETELETIPKGQIKAPGPVRVGQLEEIRERCKKQGVVLEKHLARFDLKTTDLLNGVQAEEILVLLRAADAGF